MRTAQSKLVKTTYNPVVLLEKYLSYCEGTQRLAKATVKNRYFLIRPLLRAIGKSDIRDITIYDIDDYFIDRAEILKTNALSTEKAAARYYFTFCRDYLKVNLSFLPTQITDIKREPRTRRHITKDELLLVIRHMDRQLDKLVVALMAETGMRISEITQMKVEDIRYEFKKDKETGQEKLIQVIVKGKGNKERTVFMSQNLARAIRDYNIEQRIFDGPVFRQTQYQPNIVNLYFHPDSIRKRFKRQFARAGYAWATPHDIRAAFATNKLLDGLDPRTLQLVMGHASLNTTMKYLVGADPYLEQNYRPFAVSFMPQFA